MSRVIVGSRADHPAPVPSTQHPCIFCGHKMWVSNALTGALFAGSPTACFDCFAERVDLSGSEPIEITPEVRAEAERVLGQDLGTQGEIVATLFRAVAMRRRKN